MPAPTQVRIVVKHPITGQCLLDGCYDSIALAALEASRVMDRMPRIYRVSTTSLRHWKPGPKSWDERGQPRGYHRTRYDPHCFIWIGPALQEPIFAVRDKAEIERTIPFIAEAEAQSVMAHNRLVKAALAAKAAVSGYNTETAPLTPFYTEPASNTTGSQNPTIGSGHPDQGLNNLELIDENLAERSCFITILPSFSRLRQTILNRITNLASLWSLPKKLLRL